MKKAILGFCLLLGAFAFAGVDDVVITFSTKGPDTYADGTVVLDGECYALVWTKAGAAFAGIDSEGNAVGDDSKVLLKAPVAKGGKCPNVLFQIEEGYYKSLGAGSLAVYLMDTRRFATDPEGVIDPDPAKATCGLGTKLVNGYGATDAIVLDGPSSADSLKPLAVSTGTVAPQGKGGKLRIRDLKLIEDNVYIYVEGSLPSMRYGLKLGNVPKEMKAEAKERYGVGGDKDLIIVLPKDPSGQQFISVESK